jgi:hypothetical protein
MALSSSIVTVSVIADAWAWAPLFIFLLLLVVILSQEELIFTNFHFFAIFFSEC